MFCTNCGKQQPDGAKFCTNCGASLAVPKSAGQTMQQPVAQQPAPAPAPAAAPAPTPTPEPDKKPGRGGGIGVAIACAVIVIAAAVAVYFILFAGNSGDSAQVAAAPATTVAASTDAAAEARDDERHAGHDGSSIARCRQWRERIRPGKRRRGQGSGRRHLHGPPLRLPAQAPRQLRHHER